MSLPIQTSISSEDLRAVNRPIAQARGMPNPAYTEQSWFEFERGQVLGKHWSAIAFTAQIENGMVCPIDFMGIPVLLSKTMAGDIKVFHNVCSHRGMKLVTEQKNTKGLIVCPYHAWTYAVNGELKSTPNIGGVGIHTVAELDCKKHGLKPIKSHVWLGILFINLSADAASFEQDAAPLIQRYKALMGDSGESLLRADTTCDTVIDVHCNWKLAVENYLEAYHLPTIHPGLNAYSPLTAHYNQTLSDNAAGQITNNFDPEVDSKNPLPMFPDWDSERLATGEYPVIYPNLLLGFQANHFYGIIIHPISPSRCKQQLMLFYVGDAATAKTYAESRSNNLDAWLEIFNEDISPCERMQIGRNSPGFSGGVFSPVHDTCSHHFHQWIARHYEAAVAN